MSTPTTLDEWLQWIERSHPRGIELGLDRVGRVYDALALDFTDTPIISVAGTNGKGSCVALLNAILGAAGWRTGVYTSPHFLHYNERVCIGDQPAADQQLCDAFAAVEAARGDTPLTYFEFGTLAALQVFAAQQVDVLLLEVGLGGRLDAVNIVDADIAVITSIGIDHVDWLGDTREQIGLEKAGILRPGMRAVIGDAEPPESVLQAAQQIECELFIRQQDFEVDAVNADSWSWHGRGFEGEVMRFDGLPRPSLALENAATALQVVACLNEAVERDAVCQGLKSAHAPGRCQHVDVDGVDVVLDVAHNPAAVEHLARHLAALPRAPRTAALFAVMADKDIPAMVAGLKEQVDAWFLGDLKDNERAIAAADLAPVVHEQGIHMISVSKNIRQAYRRVLSLLEPGCRLVVLGSFFTVAEVMAIMERDRLKNGVKEEL